MYYCTMFIKKSASVSKKKGTCSPTYQIAESYRDESGISRHKILLHLGTEDKFLKRDLDNLLNGLLKIKGITLEDVTEHFDSCKSLGQIWAFVQLWKDLRISQTIAKLKKKTNICYNLEEHVQALVFNRLDDPSSKLRLLSWLETVYIPSLKASDIKYEYLLRAMDFLISHKETIEDQIADRFLTLFDTSLRICFYDITSTYFEAEASLVEDDIRQLGWTRDDKPNKRQIVIGVVMTQEGIPIAHYTFDGNTSDCTTVQKVTADIKKRFGIERLTIVADKGMSSGNNLKALIDNGDDFILGESAKNSIVGKEAVNLAYEAKEKENPEAKEYCYDKILTKKIFYFEETSEGKKKIRKSFDKELRYVASYNKKVALKKRRTRQENFAKAYKYVSEINRKRIKIEDKYSDLKNYLRNKHLTRFFAIEKYEDQIEISEIKENILNEERVDGWFVVITMNKELSTKQIIKKYKDLKYVEHGFAELKHSLKLRPNFHWTKERIKAHVMVCFIAFQMACLFEKRIGKLQMTWEKGVRKLRRLHVVEWTANSRHRVGLTKADKVQTDIFSLLGCSKPTIDKL